MAKLSLRSRVRAGLWLLHLPDRHHQNLFHILDCTSLCISLDVILVTANWNASSFVL